MVIAPSRGAAYRRFYLYSALSMAAIALTIGAALLLREGLQLVGIGVRSGAQSGVQSGARSVVFSGDTAPSENLIKLAQGADVLVHEVMYLPALEKMMAKIDNAPTLLDHLLKSHTTTEQVGKVAAAAGVKTLVLSHFVPGGDPSITDETWAADVRKNFSGRIVVGKDLMAI